MDTLVLFFQVNQEQSETSILRDSWTLCYDFQRNVFGKVCDKSNNLLFKEKEKNSK